jgi:hypothetical protein
MARVRLRRNWNSKIAADLAGQILVHFSMPWNGRDFACCGIVISRVPGAVPQEKAAIFENVAHQLAPFHFLALKLVQ